MPGLSMGGLCYIVRLAPRSNYRDFQAELCLECAGFQKFQHDLNLKQRLCIGVLPFFRVLARTEKSVASSRGFVVCLSAVAAQGEAFRGPREVQGAEPMGQSTSGRAPPSPPSCMRFTISHAEVAEHNEETDCWVIIGDSVLDVTQYISIHPGGKQAILNLAGGDATEIFDLVHQRGVIKKYGLRERTITLMGMLHR